MQIKKFDSFYAQHLFVYEHILYLITPIESFYPNLSNWYRDKFIPGLFSKERGYILATENDEIVGCALLKKTAEEKKISTLFVRPDYRKKGLGRKLLNMALKELGGASSLTVSEECLPSMNSLLKQSGFSLFDVKTGLYRKGKKEYLFRQKEEKIVAKKRAIKPRTHTKTQG